MAHHDAHDDHDDDPFTYKTGDLETATATAKPDRAPRKKMKFTPLALQRLKPPKTGQTAYWDTTDGLSLLVSYGGAKAFRASFPWRGKYVFVTIGRSWRHGPRRCPGHGLRLPFEGPARHRPPDTGTFKNDFRRGGGRLHQAVRQAAPTDMATNRTHPEIWMRRMARPTHRIDHEKRRVQVVGSLRRRWQTVQGHGVVGMVAHVVAVGMATRHRGGTVDGRGENPIRETCS